VKGATIKLQHLGRHMMNFNPRTREGCDWVVPAALRAVKPISIHAPVKGATQAQSCSFEECNNFNPRTREGCDTATRDNKQYYVISIHAPVKGATVPSLSAVTRSPKFQSTHP